MAFLHSFAYIIEKFIQETIMQNFRVKAMQSDLTDYGKLQIHITSARGAQPIPGAKVAISYTGEPDHTME